MFKHFISALFLFGIFNISYGDVQTDFVAKIGETCFLDENTCSSTIKAVGTLTIEDYIDSNLPISSIINTTNQANFAVNMSFYNGQLHNHSSQISEFVGFL